MELHLSNALELMTVVGLAFLWNFIIQPGQILEAVGNRLKRMPPPPHPENVTVVPVTTKLGKALGGCRICFSFWLTMAYAGFGLMNDWSFAQAVAFVAIGHLITRLLGVMLYQE